MTLPSPGETTQVLRLVQAGDEAAVERLFELVHDDLRAALGARDAVAGGDAAAD